ncbi:16S rRNA (guanine(966)-N(2))-methyltransferase RsmD [Rossellomorea vietnamensis]|uniref:16S rRNA (Guanine(966)-N(2))-methyltransferase RsmD n=1 Tax=Rossellomorea vietnamensis TaxID=218284 RepID=A0A5D4MAV2_9BACI|nr:16S rRNA (guanine(966)-N(2))-methyltransferase RsmD [Rossellomorea vietnamensis]TYR98443.1 16S rRNA (guanine(966)-N(2))-methyltransferase RsmD [Rossellomorea vietnamensis]
MRVISGECRGRPLKSVPGSGTRPTTDKVKEAIFNIIGPYFESGSGLDLFAGSGGLGIEALSRGLGKVIFVDKDFKAIQTIKSNLDSCGYSDRSEVYRNEAGRALKAVMKRDITFDYIFLDPPYKKQKLQQLMKEIDENGLLNESGFVVCEHGSEIELPEEVGTLKTIRAESYGIIGITIYQKS